MSTDTSSSLSGPATPALDPPWPIRPPQQPARLEQAAGLLRLDGPDSLRFLHGQSSQDLQLARPGQWRHSCCLTPTGRVTALVEVLADEGGAWLVITAGEGAAVRQQLDRVLFPADQVHLGTLEAVRLIERLPASATTQVLDDDDEHWEAIAADPCAGFRLGQRRLVLRGETPLPADLAAIPALADDDAEALRISHGRAAAPGELNGETNPFELGLAARVSLNKGCYVGQETLARLVTYDGIKQQLRRWHWQGPASQAAALLAQLQPGQGLISADGERAGRITSLLQLEAEAESLDAGEASNTPTQLIGLALVRRGALEEPWLRPAAESPGDGSRSPGADHPKLRLSVPTDFSLPGT